MLSHRSATHPRDYPSFSCFLTKIFHGLFCRAKRFQNRRSQQTMNFELSHDVVCACAKRDETPSKQRPSRASLAYGLLLMAKGLTDNPISHWPSALSTAFSGYWPTSARHSVSSVLLSFIFLFFDKDFPWTFLSREALSKPPQPTDYELRTFA